MGNDISNKFLDALRDPKTASIDTDTDAGNVHAGISHGTHEAKDSPSEACGYGNMGLSTNLVDYSKRGATPQALRFALKRGSLPPTEEHGG